MHTMLSSQQYRGCSLVSSNARVATKFTHKSKRYTPLVIVQAVSTTKPTSTTSTTNVIDTIPTTTVYKDNWFDRLAIKHISQSIQAVTGIKNDKDGYESFIEASATVIQISDDTNMQQEVVIQSLNKAFPKRILSLIKVLVPESKFKRELFAMFTALFFTWLVGPCQVKESEIAGKMEKNVVHIPKCRFLDESKCVGMCVNLCKMPSQKFIKDSFGTSIYMKPNFEDMSCEMFYGQDPPAAVDDPATKQPCLKILCVAKQKQTPVCSTS